MPKPPRIATADFDGSLFPKHTRGRARARPTVPSEHEEQCALVRWASIEAARPRRRDGPDLSPLRCLFAIPNGGHRHKGTAARMAREGVRAGVPDLCLPFVAASPDGGTYGALWIELKRQRKTGVPTGRLSEQQRWWRGVLLDAGHAHAVCYGFDEGRAALLDYLDGRLVTLDPLIDLDDTGAA